MAPSTSSTVGDAVGPHPSYIQIAKPYIFDHKIKDCLLAAGVTESKEDSVRLQGVAWIDSVRKALHLPVRTYNTAVVYYHKFRLVHPDNNAFIDAAGAALFTACKIEDTLKKSKEILCAAYNLKLSPAEQVTPDDPMFEQHAKVIIGLERLMLEASGFDFRNRSPQRLILKICRFLQVDRETVGKTAYNMSLDLYRTFAPLKQTTPAMALGCVELSMRVFECSLEECHAPQTYKKWRVTRPQIMETMLDLLDVFTHNRVSTSVGLQHPIEVFINIRIALNQEASAEKYPRFTEGPAKIAETNGIKAVNGEPQQEAVPSSANDPIKSIRSPQEIVSTNGMGTPTSGRPGLRDGTVRFMLDAERAKDEQRAVSDFFKIEMEEYEVEIERERKRG